MYHLYILFCDKAFFYTGVTQDLDKRIKEHQSGFSPHTKRYKIVELVHSESFGKRSQAEERELQIKGWSREKKKALINGDLNRLRELSRNKS